jgi:hypothetical protein
MIIKIILIVALIVSFLLTIFIDIAIVKNLNGSGIKASYFMSDFHVFKFIDLIRNDKDKRNRRENLLILFGLIFFGLLTVTLFIIINFYL